jgi:hypothetical protein
MTRGLNLTITMFLAASIILVSSHAAETQEDQTPTPQMLLNLDLFTAQSGSQQQGQGGGGDSMLEQLRALRAMGYLSADGPLPDPGYSDQAASAPPRKSVESPQ